MATIKKACKGVSYPKSSSVSSRLGSPAKAKKGGSFDLNKDGKTTFKDVLIGRGVLPKTAKKGMKMKKAQAGKSVSKSSKWQKEKEKNDSIAIENWKKMNPGKPIVIPGTIKPTPKNKMGGKTKKCKYGCY